MSAATDLERQASRGPADARRNARRALAALAGASAVFRAAGAPALARVAAREESRRLVDMAASQEALDVEAMIGSPRIAGTIRSLPDDFQVAPLVALATRLDQSPPPTMRPGGDWPLLRAAIGALEPQHAASVLRQAILAAGSSADHVRALIGRPGVDGSIHHLPSTHRLQTLLAASDWIDRQHALSADRHSMLQLVFEAARPMAPESTAALAQHALQRAPIRSIRRWVGTEETPGPILALPENLQMNPLRLAWDRCVGMRPHGDDVMDEIVKAMRRLPAGSGPISGA